MGTDLALKHNWANTPLYPFTIVMTFESKPSPTKSN